MPAKNRTWTGRIFIGRDQHGRQKFHWVGRFDTKRERDAAVAKARDQRPWEGPQPDRLSCDEWADRYLKRYERNNKPSSLATAHNCLRPFRTRFGHRLVTSITPTEAETWAQTVPASYVPQIVSLFNYAKRMRVIGHNPFDGLGGNQGRGRRDQDPPTIDQLDALLDGCDALGDYADQMRALIVVAAHTGMRPGELYELRWPDIDLAANRITVSRRLYGGLVDTPKPGRAKTIALPPPARDALMRQPTRTLELVFVSKLGKQLTASTVCQYWAKVTDAAGVDFEFYLATKHLAVHNLYKLGLSTRAICAQMGWSERSADDMLRVYGHQDLVALAEVDALYAEQE